MNIEITKKILNKFSVKEKVPLSTLTTMRVGGIADLLIEPNNSEELVDLLKIVHSNQWVYHVIGNGSNTIFLSDFAGVLISSKKLNRVGKNEKEELVVEAGVLLPIISQHFLNNHWGGMEFAATIPGTLGGSLMTNAGAYGQTISDYLVGIEALNEKKETVYFARNEIVFGYRQSSISNQSLIILRAYFKGFIKDKDLIYNQIQTYKHQRAQKQPIEYPSSGSIFKNPYPHYAGSLIESVGLKGYSIGGAQIAEKHANFIINRNHATASEVVQLIEFARQKVYDKYQIDLELEVLLI